MTAVCEMAVAALGTVAFALLFGVPALYYPYCGLIGGTGWFVYSMLAQGFSEPASAMFATIAVILLSRIFAVRKQCPVTIFLISGIFPLVPGALVYWTAYYIVTDEIALAARTGFLALKVAVAIVLGIVFVFELPQGFFRFAAKKDKRALKEKGRKKR
ncbi:MAG: threonine/serine exporter [Hungatella sp.]|nr:threonine/serine exporter [Hungatella sp.]